MSLPIQKFREIVLQLLYSSDVDAMEGDDTLLLLGGELGIACAHMQNARRRMDQILEHKPKLDEAIEQVCQSYALDRIQRIDRNVLRLGIFEMLYDSSVPYKVAINEAMRLARKYSAPESSSFVNALLDNIYKKTHEY